MVRRHLRAYCAIYDHAMARHLDNFIDDSLSLVAAIGATPASAADCSGIGDVEGGDDAAATACQRDRELRPRAAKVAVPLTGSRMLDRL